MTDLFAAQIVSIGLVLAILLGPTFTAGWFLQRRKDQARKRRRSPLTTDLLRPPGLALRDQIEERRVDFALEVSKLMVVPMLPLGSFYMWQLVTGKGASPFILGVVLVLLAGFVVYEIRLLLRGSAELDKWRLGLDAEMAAGQELDQLMRQGAVVFHDLPAEKFNIDHVVIAAQGVFAVETKGFSKAVRDGRPTDATVVYDGKRLTFPDWASVKPLEQAERQAKWLGAWLTSATGQAVQATPVLALPGWFIDRKGRGAVHVLSGKELQRNLLKIKGAMPLEAEQMQRIVHQVEQRCRSALPSYRPDEPPK